MTLKRSFLSLFSILFFYTSFSQERCGSVIHAKDSFEQWMNDKKSEKALKSLLLQNRLRAPQQSVYQVPVVVHVVHLGEPIGQALNLSEERIIEQIEILNQDFRRLNPDRFNTPDIFLDVAADSEIEFILAKQDPTGLPSNGIVRVQADRNTYSSPLNNPFLRNLSYWPPEDYLNIYCLDIAGGFLGFGNFPDSDIINDLNGGNNLIDGVAVDYLYFGINPEAPDFASFGRTLTHEVGHYLGLRHMWGDGGCDDDDYVTDTPLADDDHGGYSSCIFPRDNDEVCEGVDTGEMFQNYMDYTDDGCMNLFTFGQKERMRIVLENSPNRLSLLSSPGLVDPIGLFENDISISLNDAPLVTNETNPEVILDVLNRGSIDADNFTIDLFINELQSQGTYNAAGFNTGETRNLNIATSQLNTGMNTILASVTSVNEVMDESPFNNDESFFVYIDDRTEELPTKVDFSGKDDWIITSRTDTLWERLPSDGMLRANGFASSFPGDRSWFISPVIDASSFGTLILNFQVSYGARTGSDDLLSINFSADGGTRFTPFQIINSSELSIKDTLTTQQWIPDNELWETYEYTIPQNYYTENLRVAFVFTNGNGNDLYLDNINLSNFSPAFPDNVKIFPNPVTTSSIQVGYNLATSQQSTIQLFDSSGKLFYEGIINNSFNQVVEVPAPSTNGLYYIKVVGQDFTETEKIIIRR